MRMQSRRVWNVKFHCVFFFMYTFAAAVCGLSIVLFVTSHDNTLMTIIAIIGSIFACASVVLIHVLYWYIMHQWCLQCKLSERVEVRRWTGDGLQAI